jgi:hypothetical protein
VRATFAGIDFSEAPRDEIDFSGFEFGNHADFSGCKWRGVKMTEIRGDFAAFKPGRASFNGAAFGHRTNFNSVICGDCADFTATAFGDFVNFTGAVFGDWTSFIGAASRRTANFTGATFGDVVIFTGAAFGNTASFVGARFGRRANFTGAAFGLGADFSQTHFKGGVDFAGKSEKQWTRDFAKVAGIDEEARPALEKHRKELWTDDDSGPDRFLRISFANARFDGQAIFSGRIFDKIADFNSTRFYSPPKFHGAANLARIDFTGAHIGFALPGSRLHWTDNGRIPVRLRDFRKIAEETKNHDLERDLYIEERKAERGVFWHQLVEELRKAQWIERPIMTGRLIAHILWIAVMSVYWVLADYGRSFIRPLAALIASVLFFDWRYTAVLAPLMTKAPDADAGTWQRGAFRRPPHHRH